MRLCIITQLEYQRERLAAIENARLSKASASEQLLVVCGGGGGAGRVHGADASLSEAGTSGFGLYCGNGGAPPPKPTHNSAMHHHENEEDDDNASYNLTPRSTADVSTSQHGAGAVAATNDQARDSSMSLDDSTTSSIEGNDEDDDKSFEEDLESINDAT